MTSKCNGSIKPKVTSEGQTLLYHIFYGTNTFGNISKPNTDTVRTYIQHPPHECSNCFVTLDMLLLLIGGQFSGSELS